jgi:hypothetical protein
VRKAAVATLARPVARIGRRQREFLLVAGLAERIARNRMHEVVRRVTALALDAAVKVFVGSRNLMAAAAVSHARVCCGVRRMWIVTAHAAAGDTMFGVVGMLVTVTARAGLIR